MSANRKLSWLKFWPDDYLNSERVKLMTIPQEWAYFTLIIRSARDGSVPATPEECVRLLGKGVKVKDVAVALEVFVPVEGHPGRVIHPRVLRDRAEVRAKSEKNSESANARWGKMRTHSVRNANASETHSENDANGMPRALAQEDKSTEAEADSKLSPKRAEASTWSSRPKTEEDAVKHCKGNLIAVPDDFVRRCLNQLDAVGWIDATGHREVTNFGAYVKKAYAQHKDSGPRGGFAGGRTVPEVKRQENGKVSTGINYGQEGGK